jgi:hypothetical protein
VKEQLKPHGHAMWSAAGGETHVLERETHGVKPGDVIKIVDKLSPDERIIVENLRALGPYKVHDAKAQMLERMAAAARADADVVKLTDMYPWLLPEVEPDKPAWAHAVVLISALTLVILIAMLVQQRTSRAADMTEATHPTPLAAIESTPAPPPETPSKPRRQQGRVDRPTPRMQLHTAEVAP